MITSFKDLKIYIRSKELVKEIYKIAERYPEREKYNGNKKFSHLTSHNSHHSGRGAFYSRKKVNRKDCWTR